LEDNAVRGDDRQQSAVFSHISPEEPVPRDHPWRTIVMLRLKNLKRACSNMGIINILLYIYKTKVLNAIYGIKKISGSSYKTGVLNTRQLMHHVLFRYNSSDINVFSQIFVSDEYRTLAVSQDIKLIIDCGANVGYSSAYFLSRFPEAHIIAVEPDRSNYEILNQNLSAYGDRVTTICSAVWSRNVGLKVHIGKVGEKREWATKVRECIEGEEADLHAMDIATLLNRSNHDRIDILKVDIEGSERIVFSQNFESWINKVGTLVIELHGNECREIFYRALSSGSFRLSHSGELTIAQRC
jgi:FkbM family methyltransferase